LPPLHERKEPPSDLRASCRNHLDRLNPGAHCAAHRSWNGETASRAQFFSGLLNDAADSPVTRAGSEDQFNVSVILTRNVSLDF
jgi:hypothetical protein